MPLDFDTTEYGGATVRDTVCRMCYSNAYASLDATDQALVNAIGGMALTRVQQYAQWFEQAGAESAPDAWAAFLLWLTVIQVGSNAKPDRLAVYKENYERALNDALNTFSKTDSAGTALAGQTISVAGIRLYVMLACARRVDRTGNRLFVGPDAVDPAIQWAIGHVWNFKGWNFRRRQIKITIAADGGVTDDLAGTEALDSLNVLRLVYADDPSQTITWADADQMAFRKAWDDDNDCTGRPRWFRLQRAGATLSWHFSPPPDAEYSAYGEAFIAGPGTPANASATTVFDQFTSEFGPILRQLTLGRVLADMGVEERTLADALHQLNSYAPVYDDHGVADDDAPPADVYMDRLYQDEGWC